VTEENRELIHRVSMLEIQVGRLQQAMGGMGAIIFEAENRPAACALCSLDPQTIETCAIEECPCGVPLGEKS